jgi:2-dehydro-3-deoxyphosphogluconate aldolase/(4S)-4-hydroxy-2-oxoglutarate aldolase
MAAGGRTALEVTMTVPRAVELIPRAGADLAWRRFLLGAGTVTDVAHGAAVIDAGASFVVGPVFRPT